MLMAESELDVLRDIRELLTLIAEPHLEQRDQKRRSELRAIAGGGEKNIKAIVLMDGSRTKAEIAREAPIDASQLTKLVKALEKAKLLENRGPNHNPEVVVPVSVASFVERR